MKIDFHVHSKYSFDSIMEIDNVIEVARKRGLGGIAITDHNNVKGGLEGVKLKKYQDFIVIPGIEIATNKGEILGMFLNKSLNSRTPSEVIDEIRDQGGISIIAHPYKRTKRIDEELLNRIDGTEGFNSRCTRFENEMAQQIAAEYNLPMVSGSDAHFYFEIGRGTCIIENVSELEDIRGAVIRGEARISGTESSPYVEPLSQMIRAFKTNNPKLLFTNVLLRSMSISYQTLAEKLKIF